MVPRGTGYVSGCWSSSSLGWVRSDRYFLRRTEIHRENVGWLASSSR